MLIKKIFCLVLVVLFCGCVSSTESPTPSPTPTAIPPTPVPTNTNTPTHTPNPLPTITPTLLPTSVPTSLPSPTRTPLPDWPNGFQLGAEVADIDAHSDMMASSGMTWVRYFVNYAQSAGSRIATAHERGLRVLLTVTGDRERAYEPEYQEKFVAFLASQAENGADAIEVWSEPNLDRDMKVVDPSQYTQLLCAVYTAVKADNPDTLIISGAPFSTGWFGGCTENGCDDLPWLEGMAKAGASDCFDLVGAHYTQGATGPSTDTGGIVNHHSVYYGQMVEKYYEVFDGARPLAFTLYGYLSPEDNGDLPAHLDWSKDTTIADQASWTAEAVQLSFASDKVRMVFIYNLDATSWAGDNMSISGYSLIRKDGTCPACDTLEEMLGR